MIDVGVLGSKGRMGQALVAALDHHPRCRLSIAGTRENVDPLFVGSDVVIDFTSPDALPSHIHFSLIHKRPLIIGTTGLMSSHKQLISSAAYHIPLVVSPNMSIGITLLTNFIQKAVSVFDESYDVEISELHHRHKKDAPSGTALLWGQTVAKSRGKSLEELRYNPLEKERANGAIGFAIQRGGMTIGDHSIRFIGEEEMVEFSHRGFSRKLYAKGALLAAEWVVSQKPGLYSMQDVLGL